MPHYSRLLGEHLVALFVSTGKWHIEYSRASYAAVHPNSPGPTPFGVTVNTVVEAKRVRAICSARGISAERFEELLRGRGASA